MTTSSVPSWTDAEAAVETMTAWLRRRTSAEEPDWTAPKRLMALAIWRIALERHVAVADAVLDVRSVVLLRDDKQLLAEPLPVELRAAAPQLDGPYDQVLRTADNLMSGISLRYSAIRDGAFGTGAGLGETDDQMLAPDTVGSLLTEFAQDPLDLPELAESERSHRAAEDAGLALKRRVWIPTDTEVALAHDVHGAMMAALPPEKLRELLDSAWLGRLRRIAYAGDLLRDIQTTKITKTTSPLLRELVAAIIGWIDAVTVPLSELEAAWTTRPLDQRLPYWERAHVTPAVRKRIADLEDHLFLTAPTLVAAFTREVD